MIAKSLKMLCGSLRKFACGSSPIPPSDFRIAGSCGVAGSEGSEIASLAHAIHLAGKLDRETLLAEFTSYVSTNFDEAEFARSFAIVHKVFHDWMDQ